MLGPTLLTGAQVESLLKGQLLLPQSHLAVLEAKYFCVVQLCNVLILE